MPVPVGAAVVTVPDPADLLPVRLQLILDSRSPAGAHGHSGGMEAAVSSGMVGDIAGVRDFCRGRLYTAGAVAAAFAAAGFRAWSEGHPPSEWGELDAELSARISSEAMRSASRALGSGLRRMLQATVPGADLLTPWSCCPVPAPHQPLVLGAACALTGGSPRVAARAAALNTCAGPASAAVRLLGLDPYAVHRMTAELSTEIEAVADCSAAAMPIWELPAGSAPGLEMLAEVHAREEARLFAS
jgi:urease accessory protein